jgi:hypothetical protein
MNNIVDIYNLDNLKTDCSYFTIKITFDNDKIHSLEIDGELHNKNKININYFNKFRPIFNLYDIIDDYGYDNILIGIKFKIHNINTQIIYRSENMYESSVYDDEIIIDKIVNKNFKIEFRKYMTIEKITGSIQINIYELKQSNISPYSFKYSDLEYYSEKFRIPNNFYILKLDTPYFKIHKAYTDLNIPKCVNKIFKNYEIPFIHNNVEGTIQLECYCNCSIYLYYLITKIVYNGTIIDIVQNNKCACNEYSVLDYIKTSSKFYNRKKKCLCFLIKLNNLLKELKLYHVFIKKDIFKEKLNLNVICELIF